MRVPIERNFYLPLAFVTKETKLAGSPQNKEMPNENIHLLSY